MTTFIRPLAIHNIVIPASSYLAEDRMAALYDQVWGPGGNSTLYVASLENEIDTASPGPGSYSFLLKRVGQLGSTQYNFRNAGTKAAPDSHDIYIAMNPDGETHDIVDSTTAQKTGAVTPPNQNGSLGRKTFTHGIQPSTARAYYPRLLVFEFDDAIAIVAFDATHYASDIAHFGDILAPRWSDDRDGGGVYSHRMGLAAIGGVNQAAVIAYYMFADAVAGNGPECVRLGLGNTLTDTYQAPWCTKALKMVYSAIYNPKNWFDNFGPSSVIRFNRIALHWHWGPLLGYLKYVKRGQSTSDTMGKVYKKDGDAYLVNLNHVYTGGTANQSWFWLHCTPGYDPTSLGVFT